MRIETLEGGYDDNLMYVVDTGGAGLIVDASSPVDEARAAAERLGVTPHTLLLTHTHGDHITHVAAYRDAWPDLRIAGLGPEVARLAADRHTPLEDGGQLTVGDTTFDVIATPGHYPDSLCLVGPGVVFTGDTLFVGRTGRTRGPQSDTRELYRSIRKLAPLDGALVIYPGHDYGPTPTDTLANQRATNAFLQADSEDAFVATMEAYEASRA